jgi:acetylornithine/succinyldiaminopimelate/putrescine aminotransferase/predicted amino acid dehydrogenase
VIFNFENEESSMNVKETTYLNPERRFWANHIGFDKVITRAKGNYVYSDDDQAYLDFLSQFGSIPFGHNPDFLWQTLNRIQQNQEPSFIQPLISLAAEELAKELTDVAPSRMRYVTFTNSGAETVEAAIKLARAKTQRSVILATQNGFHGKTLGAGSVTGNPIYRTPFLPDTSRFEHVPYGNLEALEARLSKKDVAAFIVEPVQGEAGMISPPLGYLPAASQLCRKAGTLFILDEVQTGMGRTGTLFAAEHENIEVDVLLLAKALGGGLVPLGACLCSEPAWPSAFGKYHTSTFANSYLSCSIGLATLRYLLKDDRALIQQAKQRGEYLRQKLEILVKAYPTVFEKVTGQGLMQGLHLAPWSGEGSWAMFYASSTGNSVTLLAGYLLNEHHIITCPTINTHKGLRIEPPLTIEEAEIDRLADALEDAAQLLVREDYASLLSFTIGESVKSVAIPKDINFSHIRSSAPLTPPNGKCTGKFAFLTHVPDTKDFMQMLPSAMEYLNQESKTKFNQWVTSWASSALEPGVAYHIPDINSKVGGYVEGWLVANLLTSRQILELSRSERAKLIQNYVDMARSLGANVIGLGAFTSIITDSGTTLANCGLVVTTGSSLTAIASVESLKIVAKARGADLESLNVGIVGATGSIGRIVSHALASTCSRLVLFGNPANLLASQNLKIVVGELYQDIILSSKEKDLTGIGKRLHELIPNIHRLVSSNLLEDDSDNTLIQLYEFIEERLSTLDSNQRPIQITTDLERYLPEMGAVISATSQGYSFINPALLASNAIICDTAKPNDVLTSVKVARPDTFVYEGGLVTFPEHVSLGLSNFGLPTGVTLGCFAEMIVLAMAGVRRNYSIGKRVPLSEAMEVYNMAKQHGFGVYIPETISNTSITSAKPLVIK